MSKIVQNYPYINEKGQEVLDPEPVTVSADFDSVQRLRYMAQTGQFVPHPFEELDAIAHEEAYFDDFLEDVPEFGVSPYELLHIDPDHPLADDGTPAELKKKKAKPSSHKVSSKDDTDHPLGIEGVLPSGEDKKGDPD